MRGPVISCALVALATFGACASRSDGIVQTHYGDFDAGASDGGAGSSDGGDPTDDDAGPAPTYPANAITFLVEPNGNKGGELRAEIYAATKSVYMTMYTIDDSAIIKAIEGALG